MKLQDVNEVVDKLIETYDGAKTNNLECYIQVLWNPSDKARHFRISFEKEKSGGYIADVFYKTFLGNVHTKINKRSELEACMSLEKGGTDMEQKKQEYKVGDKVKVIANLYNLSGIEVGKIYTIEGLLADDVYFVNGNIMFEIELEPVLTSKKMLPKVQIITKNPATVILWENGDKTVVKCMEGDTYNELFGIALATLKYQLGNNQVAGRKAYELLSQHASQPSVLDLFKAGKFILAYDSKQEYDDLMHFLESLGFTWNSEDKPTKWDGYRVSARTLGVVVSMQNRFGITTVAGEPHAFFNSIKGLIK